MQWHLNQLGWRQSLLWLGSSGLLATTILTNAILSTARSDEPTGRKKAVIKKVLQRAGRPAADSPTATAKNEPAAADNSSLPKSASLDTAATSTAYAVAAEVDRLIEADLAASKFTPADLVNDEDFLRRVSFDIAGTPPSAKDVTLFGLDTDPNKRAVVVDRLLASEGYATNWARYWRDVLFLRATNERARLMVGSFEDWMAEQLRKNASWSDITRALLTATGDVQENGATALMFIHEANQEEIAGEASRIFLGIQMQCANCHDHPTDKWTRDQFHSLAAFFPRVSVRREPNDPRAATIVSFDGRGPRPGFGDLLANADRFFNFNDTNKDGKLSKDEAAKSPLARGFDRLLELGDENRDNMLSLKELKSMPPPMLPPGRGSEEHFMPDLAHPNDQGKLMTPAFFVTNAKGRTGMEDEDRRELIAKFITSPTNPWFAKSFVNRLWGELLGEGFYMPIDDMGPERKPRMGAALDLLAAEFVKHNHDIQWLLRTITATRAYQRQVRYNEPTENPVPFASAVPSRLRSDHIFNSIIKVLGVEEGPRGVEGPAARFRRSPRQQFEQMFGYDPSTPQDELLGNVPQALILMNFQPLTNALRAEGNTRLGQILNNNQNDADALSELYLAFLAREPSDKERAIATEYIAKVGNRREAFEDLAWSLLNSSEFLSKR